MTKEEIRLAESGTRKKHWKRWGPYLSEHVWGTVREDYSLHGNAWEYLPHDHARSRAYRWNEEMILSRLSSFIGLLPVLLHRNRASSSPV